MEWVGTVWFWAGLALALFAAEALLPGAFLLWLGFAAAALAAIRLVLPDMGLVAQCIMFALLALASAGLGWKLRGQRLRGQRVERNDSPLLNRRSAQLVGRTLPLVQPIINGRGQVRLDDAYWIVEGPDLPLGATVRIVAADAMLLRVVPVE